MLFITDYSKTTFLKKQNFCLPEPVEPHSSLFVELQKSIYAALECYSNVHRGSGQFSQASTFLYEQARRKISNWMGLDEDNYTVIFCTPRRMKGYIRQLERGDFRFVTSEEIGLALGVCALAVKKTALRKIRKMDTGGGAVRLVSRRWTVWADAPERLEAGTPAVINILGFVRALWLLKENGYERFDVNPTTPLLDVDEILFSDTLPSGGMELLQTLRSSLVGKNLLVPCNTGETRYTNLDNAASTPTFEAVWQSARLALLQPITIQQSLIRTVKEICADYLDTSLSEYEVVFVNNTTEALNLAAELQPDAARGEKRVIINTLLEHHSNELPWREVPEVEIIRVGIDTEGFVDLHAMEEYLSTFQQEREGAGKRICLVAMNAASNVLGTYTPLDAVSALAHRAGASILVDAAQLVAHRPCSLRSNKIDFFAFSGHKIYAPFGCGVLLVRKEIFLNNPKAAKILEGAKKSGEENVMGIAALGKALLLLKRIGMENIAAEESRLTGRLLEGLAKTGAQVFGVQGTTSERFNEKGPVVTFHLPEIPHNLVVRELADTGAIGVRDGCFCAHLLGKHLMRIHPLRERLADLGVLLFPHSSGDILPGMIRVSIGLENDAEDIDHFLRVLEVICSRHRTIVDRWIATHYNGTPFAEDWMQSHAQSDFLQVMLERVLGSSRVP